MLALAAAALAADPYRAPPDDVAAVLDARRPPLVDFSDDHAWLLLFERPALPPIAEVAAPVVKVAGVRLDPRTRGPARENPFTSVSLRRTLSPTDAPIPVPVPGRVRSASFDASGAHLLLTVTVADGIEAWLADVGPDPRPRRLLDRKLQAAAGAPCVWLHAAAGASVVCRVVPEGLGPPPVEDPTPVGPRVEENLGRRTPNRTYPDLLEDAHDEALLEHWLRSEVVEITLDGAVRPLAAAGLWSWVQPSPDGAWVLLSEIVPPYSRRVPFDEFAKKVQLVERATRAVRTVAELPVADDVPVSYDSVRTGRRFVGWRSDRPATLWWVEALDGGDAGKEVAKRDALEVWDAPFDRPQVRIWESERRFGGVQWGGGDLALVTERWTRDRRLRTWRIAPDDPAAAPVLLWDRSYQDDYADPGAPETERGPWGWVLKRTARGGLLLVGDGVSPTGVHPFLDRLDPDGRTTRLWQSADPLHERVMGVLDREGKDLLTWRQSQTEVPNLWRRRGAKATPLTAFTDWAPAFADVRKEVVTYTRADGLPLSATVYFPPGHDPARDGPLPALFWVYPSEFKHRSDAGQVTAAENTFSRPGGASHLFFLSKGWIVVDDPVLPIVAEGDAEPNDTYVEQLVAGADAAVDALAARGWIDRDRLVVGGHSYGAFTTANLLAHTDLFRAGIARSGAYNRTLTPFGFQGEQRAFWEAPDTYVAMSPFRVADRVDEPLLLVHGGDDSNPGTWPLQSERFYEALKGEGAVVRWVELPAEDHGYRARESVGHVLWEMFEWADRYAGPTPPAP